jgi:hypothetical protein
MASYKYQCRECGKTYVGLQLPARMSCNCTPAKQITGVRTSTLLSPSMGVGLLSSDTCQKLPHIPGRMGDFREGEGFTAC